MPDQTPEPLTDDELREIIETPDAEMLPDLWVDSMAREILAARARIAELERQIGSDRVKTAAAVLNLECQASAERERACARITELEAAQDEARVLIGWFADDEPCNFDHHGSCQAHDYVLEPGEQCPNETAKQWLTAHPVAEGGA